jgi:hypothetical protein
MMSDPNTEEPPLGSPDDPGADDPHTDDPGQRRCRHHRIHRGSAL